MPPHASGGLRGSTRRSWCVACLCLPVLCLPPPNPSCHITQELSLREAPWPQVSEDVWFRNDNETNPMNVNESGADGPWGNVGTEPYVWSYTACNQSTTNFEHNTTTRTLAACPRSGYLGLHNNAGDCVDTLTEIVSGPTELGPPEKRGVQTVYRSTTGREVTVAVMCDPARPTPSLVAQADNLQASVGVPTADQMDPADIMQYDDVKLTYSSKYGCRLHDQVCGSNYVYCRNGAFSCMGSPGVCVNASCLTLTKEQTPQYEPRGVNVRKTFKVVDTCRNLVVSGLSTDSFVIKVDNETILPTDKERAVLVTPNVGASSQMLVSLALDQSASVVNGKSDLLIKSVQSFITSLYPDSATTAAPKTGIFVFDGSPDIITLQPSFSSDKAALLQTVNTQLPKYPGDLQSTNLYGAVEKVIGITDVAANGLAYTTGTGAAAETIVPKKSVVIFSDGEDTSKRFNRQASIERAADFRARNPNADIFFVDLSEGEKDVAFAKAVVGSEDRYFKVSMFHPWTATGERTHSHTHTRTHTDVDDLAETFANIGRLLQTQNAKYSLGMCTPLRTGIHGVFVSLNKAVVGVESNEIWWPFGTENMQKDCTKTTLTDASKALAKESATAKTALPVLSQNVVSITTTSGYFRVDLTNMIEARVYVASNVNATTILVEDGSGTCEVPTRYCQTGAARGVNAVDVPTKAFQDLTNNPTVTGFASFNQALNTTGDAVELRLFFRSIPPTPLPTPTPPVVPAPESDDSGFNWPIFIISVIGVLVIALCLLVRWAVNRAKNKKPQPLQEEPGEEQLQESQMFESDPQRQRPPTYQGMKDGSAATELPVNFREQVQSASFYSMANPPTSPSVTQFVQPSAVGDSPVGMNSPNTMNSTRAYHPLVKSM